VLLYALEASVVLITHLSCEASPITPNRGCTDSVVPLNTMTDVAMSSQAANSSSDSKPDASQLQASIDTNATDEVAGSGSTTVNGTLDHPMQDSSQQNDASDEQSAGTLVEAKIPTKKDATLREFIAKMDEHAPIVSDALDIHLQTDPPQRFLMP
jgi:flagellum-specific peptidoglycan hydrolase FlgJ